MCILGGILDVYGLESSHCIIVKDIDLLLQLISLSLISLFAHLLTLLRGNEYMLAAYRVNVLELDLLVVELSPELSIDLLFIAQLNMMVLLDALQLFIHFSLQTHLLYPV